MFCVMYFVKFSWFRDSRKFPRNPENFRNRLICSRKNIFPRQYRVHIPSRASNSLCWALSAAKVFIESLSLYLMSKWAQEKSSEIPKTPKIYWKNIMISKNYISPENMNKYLKHIRRLASNSFWALRTVDFTIRTFFCTKKSYWWHSWELEC